MNRPADTIAKLADYLWWLLPTFLKKKNRAESLLAQFTDIWGEQLDDVRETLISIIPELLVATASGDYLDLLARQHQVFRGENEDDESLRTRVLAAYTIKQKGGTIPGLIEALSQLGYTVEVLEPCQGTPTWSRFLVKILAWNGIVTPQKAFYQTLRTLKPAHTLPLIDSELTPRQWNEEPHRNQGTWNDWKPS